VGLTLTKAIFRLWLFSNRMWWGEILKRKKINILLKLMNKFADMLLESTQLNHKFVMPLEFIMKQLSIPSFVL